MSQIVRVKLFGVLRNSVSDSELEVEIGDNCTVSEFRVVVGKRLAQESLAPFDEKLLADCAVADEAKILALDEKIENPVYLAVLPPVCGG